MQSCIFWHWCIVDETLGDANQVSALRIAQTFTSRAEMKRRQMKNTEMWHMIYGTYYGCFRAPSRVGSAGSVLSFWQEKEKKTLGWLRLSVVPSFSLSPTFPLCLSVSFSFWPLMLCPTPSLPPSLHSFFLPFIPFVFHPLSSLHLLSTAFHWAERWVLPGLWAYGGLCHCRHCHFFPPLSFSLFVRWRFNPLLTLRFHMLRQQCRIAASL